MENSQITQLINQRNTIRDLSHWPLLRSHAHLPPETITACHVYGYGEIALIWTTDGRVYHVTCEETHELISLRHVEIVKVTSGRWHAVLLGSDSTLYCACPVRPNNTIINVFKMRNGIKKIYCNGNLTTAVDHSSTVWQWNSHSHHHHTQVFLPHACAVLTTTTHLTLASLDTPDPQIYFWGHEWVNQNEKEDNIEDNNFIIVSNRKPICLPLDGAKITGKISHLLFSHHLTSLADRFGFYALDSNGQVYAIRCYGKEIRGVVKRVRMREPIAHAWQGSGILVWMGRSGRLYREDGVESPFVSVPDLCACAALYPTTPNLSPVVPFTNDEPFNHPLHTSIRVQLDPYRTLHLTPEVFQKLAKIFPEAGRLEQLDFRFDYYRLTSGCDQRRSSLWFNLARYWTTGNYTPLISETLWEGVSLPVVYQDFKIRRLALHACAQEIVSRFLTDSGALNGFLRKNRSNLMSLAGEKYFPERGLLERVFEVLRTQISSNWWTSNCACVEG